MSLTGGTSGEGKKNGGNYLVTSKHRFKRVSLDGQRSGSEDYSFRVNNALGNGLRESSLPASMRRDHNRPRKNDVELEKILLVKRSAPANL